MSLLLCLGDIDPVNWRKAFKAALPDHVDVVTRDDADFDPSAVRYMYVWKPAADAFDGLDNLEVIFSLGAGVDPIVAHPKLPRNVPLSRFVDEDLTTRMTDYVVAQVTLHQRQTTYYMALQKAREWVQYYPPAANECRVGIMGLGALGADAAEKLVGLGFTVLGWSRNHKDLPGVESFAGPGQLDAFLSKTDILVCLLPLTEDTRGMLDYELFTKLRRDGLKTGPVVVNAARGGHLIEKDLVRALEDGTLGAASLDVFEVEPLPGDSPLWAIENCLITPHIAAISSVHRGVRFVVDGIARHEAGEPLENLVDLDVGY